MAKYLVTGAAGFIGSRVTELLLESGHQVIGIDNLAPTYDLRLKDYRLKKLLDQPGFSFFRLDIAQRPEVEALDRQVGHVDGMVHLAALAGVRSSLVDPWSYYGTNVTGTLNLLEYCRRNRVPKFVLASTSSIYGQDAPQPTPEGCESSRPIQPYAASKKAAEVLSYTYHHLYELDITIFRYFTVYGPAGRPDMAMFRFTQWIAENRPVHINGDGDQSRGFTYVDDIAHGTLLGLKPAGFDIINLGGHEVITINGLISLLEERLGKKAIKEHHPSNPADMHGNWADVSKAKQCLGWEPRYTLAEGVKRMTDWYLAERGWASQIATT